eukprot:1440004-Pyramimonas_sp.AAC.1
MQLHQMGFHMIELQESRCKAGKGQADGYLEIHSGTDIGNHGCALLLDLLHPSCAIYGKP